MKPGRASPALGCGDCTSCALSTARDDGGHLRLDCDHPDLAVAGSGVELYRSAVAELDALGWPSPTVARAAPCPGWNPAWGEEAA